MSNLKDILSSFKIKDELNPKIWDTKNGEYTLKPKIREQLLKIAYEFFESLKVNIIISDITFTGSLSNFNWSNFSDIDLHLIADFSQFDEEDLEIYEELFLLKKTVFNEKHDIKILGYEVELYVQDENEEHTSTGVYSVLHNEWISEPKKETKNINIPYIRKKSENWMKEIDSVIELSKEEPLDEAKELLKKFKDKVKKYRQCGLEKGGEYSIENLVFKVLRRNGYIEKLFDENNKIVDKKLSIREQSDIKDPDLEDSEKAKFVKPDVDKFYENLQNINQNIKQQEAGDYSYQEDVETVQIALDILGYPLPRFGVDGKYGPETAKAVGDFKKDNNLTESLRSKRKNYLSEKYEDLPQINDIYPNIEFASRTKNDRLPKELLDDIQKAASDAGITVQVDWAKTGHKKMSNSGHVSRHWHGLAVDVSHVNGKNWYSKNDAINKGIYDDIESFVKNMGVLGYKMNNEYNQEKSLLYFGFPDHDNHLHISNKDEGDEDYSENYLERFKNFISSFGSSNSSVSDDIKSTITPEMCDKLVEKLNDLGLTSEDLEPYTKEKINFDSFVINKDKDFYESILESIGAPKSENNLKFLAAWRQAEGGSAKNNPFNTTFNLDSDSSMTYYNCIDKNGKATKPTEGEKKCPSGYKPGVKNYSSKNYGLEATVKTLKNGRYSCIVNGLKEEKDPKEIAKCDDLDTWGTGGLVSKVLNSSKITPQSIAT